MDKLINPATGLKATMTMPGDTAISSRAALLSAIAKSPVEIFGYSSGLESQSTLACLEQLGILVERKDNSVIIHGKGISGIEKPDGPINVGSSGPAARMICGILASCDFETEIHCDEIISNLPMRRIIEPLEKMGAVIKSNNFRFPLLIRGTRLKGIRYAMPIFSSQVKGGMLLAGLCADGDTEIIERISSRDHLERLLYYFGVRIKKSRYEQKSNDDALAKRFKKEIGIAVPDVKGEMLAIKGGQQINSKPIIIPGDISSAAYFLIAGLLTRNSEMRVENVSLNPTRLGFVDVLKKMKAQVGVKHTDDYGREPVGNVEIKYTQIKGRRMVGELIPAIIDELPIMSIVAAVAQGTSVIRDAYELRNQKTDRIKVIAANLRKMGVKVGELDDGLAIDGGVELEGAEIDTYGDHRIAMSFAVAGLIAKGQTLIKDAECVDYSYPGFWDDFDKLTGKVPAAVEVEN